MQNLGSQVLLKIENLLSEIGTSNPSSRRYRKQTKTKTISTSSKKTQQMLSYSYLKHQKKNLSKNIDKLYVGQTPYQQFKVKNKRSLSILNSKNIKPIHERLDEIVAKKRFKMTQREQQMRQIEENTMRNEIYSFNEEFNGPKRMNEEALQLLRNELNEKNHNRLKKKHIQELSRIDREVNVTIPAVNRLSKSLSKKHNLQKNYSQDVFVRMSQQILDRETRDKDRYERRVEEEGGFKPVLCQKSRVLAQRSPNTNDSTCHTKCKEKLKHKPFKRSRSRSKSPCSKSPIAVPGLESKSIKNKKGDKITIWGRSPQKPSLKVIKSKFKPQLQSTHYQQQIQTDQKDYILAMFKKANIPLETSQIFSPPQDKVKQNIENISKYKRKHQKQNLREKVIVNSKPVKIDFQQVSPIDDHKCSFHSFNKRGLDSYVNVKKSLSPKKMIPFK